MNKPIALAVAIGGALAFGSANAQPPVANFFNPNGQTLLSDDSAEVFINMDGSTNGAGVPTLTTGDVFFVALGINTLDGGAGTVPVGGAATTEITAFGAFKITAEGGLVIPAAVQPQGIDLFSFSFGPLDGTETIDVGLGPDVLYDWGTGTTPTGEIVLDLFRGGAGVPGLVTIPGFTDPETLLPLATDGAQIAVVQEDATPDFDRGGTLETGFDTAVNGLTRLALTQDPTVDPGDPDLFSSISPDNLADFLTVSEGEAIALSSFFFNWTVASQFWPGALFGDDIRTGAGGGGVGRTISPSEFGFFDNTDIVVDTFRVPEPGTLALFGIATLGFGAASSIRRRKQKQA